MTDAVSTGFMARLAAKKAAEAEKLGLQIPNQAGPPPRDYSEDIPDLGPVNISPEQKTLDEFIAMLTIVDAYRHWCGKSQITPSGRKEIKVSCPNPAHQDKEASCSLNTEKNVFMCFICGGGDIWDIAAWNKGYPVPGYKNDPKMFRELRQSIGAEFGLHVEERKLTTVTVTEEQLPPVAQIATVANAQAQEEEFERALADKRMYARIPWRDIVPEGTFLRAYLEAASVDDCPEEYHFWNGLVAVGLAVGRKRILKDIPTIQGNLYVCLTGGTGMGKSKSKRVLTDLLAENLPWKKDDLAAKGVKRIAGAQSGEFIVKSFVHRIDDPAHKTVLEIPGMKGLVNFEELAELIGKSGRQGSTLKQLLMDLYDGSDIASGSLTHGETVAQKPFGSLITTTQVKSIRALISRADDSSGFANRWIYATGVPKRQFSINEATYDFMRAGGLLRIINSEADNIEVVTWEPQAKQVWDDFFQNTIMKFRYQHDGDVQITQRIDLSLKKLFLLFAINQRLKIVTPEIVERVLTLYPHMIETYQIIDEQISASEHADDEELVLRQLQRMTTMNPDPNQPNRGPTVREIQQMCGKRIKSAAHLKRILETFVALGLAEKYNVSSGPNGGRPTVRFAAKEGGNYAV